MKILESLFDGKKVEVIQKKRNAIFVIVDNKEYVVKKCDTNKICTLYNYLNSREFDNFPKIEKIKDNYIAYEFIDGSHSSIEEKEYDMIKILSVLHSKTTYYKEIDIDEYKKVFESIFNEIEKRNLYYNNLIDNIEIRMFESPSDYLIARNISIILGSLEYSKITLNKWYDLVREDAKERIVTLHNNINLDHLIRGDETYLVSWDKSINGIPVYDLYNFYIKYFDITDFRDLLNCYEKKYQLREVEKLLLFCLISIPDLIIITNDEILNCKRIKRMIDRLYKSETLIAENDKK